MTLRRVGFVGTGWIGRHRMTAMCEAGLIIPAAIFEPDAACLSEARRIAPDADIAASLDSLLGMALDGVVIATPSALHAQQAILAFHSGAAVFCQKPLGRDADEVRAVVGAAREADRLLGGDFSYRHTSAVAAIRPLIESGALGHIFGADLAFHNAYGPDKPWFYDKAQSGGGCVIDLGIHLVDLLLSMLGFPEVRQVSSRLYAQGQRLQARPGEVEDFATAELDLEGDISARLACSWRLNAGQDAVIGATFYGTEGAVSIRNVAGSFYDFEALLWRGTSSEILASPPDDWGGRAAMSWARQLCESPAYDPQAEEFLKAAQAVDRIYDGA